MANGAILVFVRMTCDPACRTVMAGEGVSFHGKSVIRLHDFKWIFFFFFSYLSDCIIRGRKTKLKLRRHSLIIILRIIFAFVKLTVFILKL